MVVVRRQRRGDGVGMGMGRGDGAPTKGPSSLVDFHTVQAANVPRSRPSKSFALDSSAMAAFAAMRHLGGRDASRTSRSRARPSGILERTRPATRVPNSSETNTSGKSAVKGFVSPEVCV